MGIMKFIKSSSLILIVILMTSCNTLLHENQGIFGKAQLTNQKAVAKIQVVENQQSQSNEDKLKHIGALSSGGVEHALSLMTNPIPKEVVVAKEMNSRVEALAGKPDFNEVQAIKGIVDDLLSQVETVKQEGEKALADKDKEISKIQAHDIQLDKQREDEIAGALAQSDVNAKVADQYKATLSEMDSWGGLGAIWYGIHRLVIRMAWILGIGSVLFLILRLLASSNPIAGAIFNVFEQMCSWVINTLSVIFPKALTIAGNVSTEIYDSTKGALKSIVDSVETVKLQGNAAGTPATIEDLLNTAEVTMTAEDKVIIEQIKLEMGWIKPSVISTVVPPIVISKPTFETASSIVVTSSLPVSILPTNTTGSKV